MTKLFVANLRTLLGGTQSQMFYLRLRREVLKKLKDLKLLVTVTGNLRIEVEVSKVKSFLKWILSLISYTWYWCWFKLNKGELWHQSPWSGNKEHLFLRSSVKTV